MLIYLFPGLVTYYKYELHSPACILYASLNVLDTIVILNSCFMNVLATDRFGESMGGSLTVAEMAWPNPWVILIGSFLSTCGAGLQCLVGE